MKRALLTLAIVTSGFAVVSRGAYGQAIGPVQGAPLGAAFDAATGSLLPIRGVPGSATLGEEMNVSANLSSAAISSERNYALGVNRDTGVVVLVEFANGILTKALQGAAPFPERIALSPAGKSAVLWHAAQRRAEIVSGLPGSPAVKSLDLSSIDRDPDLFAVSDEGAAFLIASSMTAAGHLVRVQASGSPVLIPYTGQIAAMTFLRNSPDALLADAQARQLVLVHDAANGEARVSPLSTPVQIAPSESIGLSRDNSRAILANPQDASVTVVDLSTDAAARADCHCSISGLIPLTGRSVFQLTDAVSGPITVVDASGSQPSFSIIPARPRADN